MPNTKRLYRLMLIVAAGFIAYVLYVNFIADPRAESFLSHKTNLKHPINVSVWLNVLYVHVAFACAAMVSGAINFSQGIVYKHRRLHRFNGYFYLIAVFAVVITSGYMAPAATGGKAASMAFNLLNVLWPAMTVTAVVQIRRMRVDKHRKWMCRSYSFCFTNMFIHLFTFIGTKGFGLAYEKSYTVSVYGSIVLLLLLAELVIRTVYSKPAGGLQN
ncbi:DUF2306 domain-containing protein [Paenibacillus sepulcri]|uniref:DUF2306 domain-containing protein n=1 Tax=Paenibacillus sepulcri TaxID=359917 RepID=A0ABS7C6T6_9BACL|nr:DUF2306 domain-containing protein [Paenibacillus sepulcri]